jgi:gamma-glutamyltranspeptidase / glutathione hydrolase
MNYSIPLLLWVCVAGTTKVAAQTTSAASPTPYTIQKTVTAAHGAVVSAHPLASQAGLAILQKGGNAIDAAITVQLTLAVVFPGAGNIGGGGFMVAHMAKKGRSLALDYRETAPGKASRDMYIDSSGKARTDWSQTGHLACGVPGTIAGMFTAHKYGKLPFRDLIQPAIDLAENGFVLSEAEANNLNNTKTLFLANNTGPIAFVRDQPWKAGDTLVQKELAATLRLIRDKGAKGFYRGQTAAYIVAEMSRGGGLISLDDLKHYKAVKRPVLTFPYESYTIVTMPMPSSGGVLLGQMLKMVEAKTAMKSGYASVDATQIMIEAERRAFADRATYMGDPDFVQVPVAALLSDVYLRERMQDFVAGKAGSSKNVQAGVVAAEHTETTHFDVIDGEGNCVSVTTTLNGWYGSKTVAGQAGFFLNNEMDDFSVKPGVPNMFGAVGGAANAIAPHKRMLSSMTPTIVLKDGKPFLIAGTPGGTTIPTSVFQTVVDIIDFHLSAEDAVNFPKFHHQWLPDEVDLEKGFSDSTAAALTQMGYTLKHWGGIGRTEVIQVQPDGTYKAVADKRGDDSAAGY